MTPDEVVDVVTPEQIGITVARHLEDLGVSYEQLREQAEAGEFQSNQARLVWMAVENVGAPA